MDQEYITNLQTSYDRVAEEYTRRIYDELKSKPFDRSILERFAGGVRGLGPVCDLGCGPGHVARYLRELQVNVFGLDLSYAMVEQARRLNPRIEFQQGDMLGLNFEDGALGGIVAFYSIKHIPRDEIANALREMKRVMRLGGLLLLAFHAGEEEIHLDEWWGRKVSLNTFFLRPAEVEAHLEEAGFEIEEVIEREPYEGVEYPSRRAYIFAKKP